ncbi:MAG: sensor histidine kinase [Planctomycetota bacterium]
MKLGFRPRLVLGGLGIVLLTLLVGGALAGDAVRNNFSRYARHEARNQAEDLAIYLEAWLNRSGHQEDPGPALQRFLLGAVDDFLPYSPDDEEGPEWGMWMARTADLLGLTAEALERALQDQSLEELCWSLDRSPYEISSMILAEEERILREEWPDATEAEAVDYLAEVLSETLIFVFADLPSFEDYLESPEAILPERLAWFLDTLIDGSRILVVDPGGRILFDLDDGPLGGLIDEQLWQDAAPIHDWRDGSLMCEIAVAAGPGYYRGEANQFLKGVQGSLLKSAVFLLAAAVLFTLWLGRRVLAPIQALTEATTRLAQGETEGRLPVTSEDEVGRMSASFNAMLDALEQQRALRKRMVADLAHELNTPLSVLQLELAGLEAGLQSPEECAKRIGVELEVMKRLAADVGLLTELDQGSLPIQSAPTDAVACCHEAVQRWSSKAATKQVALQYGGVDSLPKVHADGLRVVQVLGNLISNAIRHTNAGGTIEVRAKQVVGADGQAAVEIAVEDSGAGIAPAQLEIIFERFVRSDEARTRETAGRGLGLSIVTDLVQRHGGRVWVESEIGKGSVFRFTLPIESRDPAA